jgi:uncharacterized protein (DUF885 family)
MRKTAILLICIAHILQAELKSPLEADRTTTNSALLKQITDEYWQHELEESLYLRMKHGLPITNLPDPSYQHAEQEAAFCKSILQKLSNVDSAKIDHEEFLSYQILNWECSQTSALLPYFWLSSPVTPYASSLSVVSQVFSTFSLENDKDRAAYVKLVAKVPSYVQALQTTVQEQEEKGFRIPKEELRLVIPFIASFAKSGKESPFFSRKVSEKDLFALINHEVAPAFQKLVDFLNGSYQKNAPENVGLSQYPNGKDYYRLLVRFHTTMDVTPEQVHETGMEAVRRLQQRMQNVRDSLNFKGTQAEFHQMLKKDPRFIPKTPEEIGEKMLSYDRRIAPKIPEYFSLQPKAPHTVKRLDPKFEGSMTFGYYQVPTKNDPVGTYLYNASNLPERPLFNTASVIYHELVPGHHFQINLQSENISLPPFRREGGHTAFVEGWAEYASGLAEEMGMYQDPYELYGRLAAEMFLTVRLVVDTGMNYFGWSRSKAMEFMKANLLESDTQIQTETLRYSCDIPGQALGYKMGSMKFRSLREKAKVALDIRKFHAVVLGSGSMPMTVLEEHVDWALRTTN